MSVGLGANSVELVLGHSVVDWKEFEVAVGVGVLSGYCVVDYGDVLGIMGIVSRFSHP